MPLHVSLSFAQLPDLNLATMFTPGVVTGLSGNPNYTTLPSDATLPMVSAALLLFNESLPIAEAGGPIDTVHKNTMRANLLAFLYILANYVEGNCGGDLEKLLSSGFQAASQERRRLPLEKPASVTAKSGAMEGQIVCAVKPPVKNCHMYEGRAQLVGATDYLPSVFTGDSQHVTFNALTPGALYSLDIRALGGSTGSSDWSDPVQHRAP